MRFLYVMSESDKKQLEALGYTLIKSNEEKKVWIFKNKDTLDFSNNELIDLGIRFVLSDVLTF